MNIKSFEKNHPFSTFFFTVYLRLKSASHVHHFLADHIIIQNYGYDSPEAS